MIGFIEQLARTLE